MSALTATRTLEPRPSVSASREGPKDWGEPGFDDAGWPAARVQAPYGKGAPIWQNLIWESVVQEQFAGTARPIVPAPAGNVRLGGADGFPPLDSRSLPGLPALPTDPGNDAEFLRYPRTSPLATAGADKAPAGVPPLK